MTEPKQLLSIQNLDVHFRGPRTSMFSRHTQVQALKSVSLSLSQGETVGLVGESGSGKSTLAKTALGLVPISSGSITWDGTELPRNLAHARHLASGYAQMIFQDPYSSLNPIQSVGSAIGEVLAVRMKLRQGELNKRKIELLDAVHLPKSALDRYPAEFSGGQRQRIVIARALAAEPKVLVCDEPLSALDVTTQTRMIGLLIELRERTGMAMLFIGHDLSVVHHLSDRMLVMYRGEIVEQGTADDVYLRPKNAYTQRLLASIPVADPNIQRARRVSRLALKEKESA